MHNSCATIYHVKCTILTLETVIRAMMRVRVNIVLTKNSFSFFRSFIRSWFIIIIFLFPSSLSLSLFFNDFSLACWFASTQSSFVFLQFTSVTICAQSHARRLYTLIYTHLYGCACINQKNGYWTTRCCFFSFFFFSSVRGATLFAQSKRCISALCLVQSFQFIIWSQSQHNPFSAPGGSATGYWNRIDVVHRLTNWNECSLAAYTYTSAWTGISCMYVCARLVWVEHTSEWCTRLRSYGIRLHNTQIIRT